MKIFMRKRKVCFVITSEIHYARNKLILEELRRRPDVELQIVVAAGALLDLYGDVMPQLAKDGYRCDAKIVMTIQGGSCVAMAKTTGLGIIEFSTVFENLKPDIVVIRGDRYEMLAAAIAAAYLNICLAHIEGGDISGNIDESVRHAITKLSHIHFVTNEWSARRVLAMGEKSSTVFNVGSPEIELLSKQKFETPYDLINKFGVGGVINLRKPYMVVMFHPVTSEVGAISKNVQELIDAIHESHIPTIWYWPNPDAGTDEVAGTVRRYRELHKPDFIRFLKYQLNEIFMGILQRARCLVGNSSTGIKECSYFGIPVVNIGTRQEGRLRAANVCDVDYRKNEIIKAVRFQYEHGKYPSSHVYYQKGTSRKVAEILSRIALFPQKHFSDDIWKNPPSHMFSRSHRAPFRNGKTARKGNHVKKI